MYQFEFQYFYISNHCIPLQQYNPSRNKASSLVGYIVVPSMYLGPRTAIILPRLEVLDAGSFGDIGRSRGGFQGSRPTRFLPTRAPRAPPYILFRRSVEEYENIFVFFCGISAALGQHAVYSSSPSLFEDCLPFPRLPDDSSFSPSRKNIL